MTDHRRLPDGLDHLARITRFIGRRRPAFFLDFDGTLAPISATPSSTTMSPRVREVVARLAAKTLVCVISGRGLADLQSKVHLDTVYYAADHGYRVVGPGGSDVDLEISPTNALELEAASRELGSRLQSVAGAVIETKGVTLSVHYRLVAASARPRVDEAVKAVAASSPGLRLSTGKSVYEFTPDLGWNKGRAMVWLLKRLGMRRSSVCPICVGDDRTDEDMFAATRGWGISLVVGDALPDTQAEYHLKDADEVCAFLDSMAARYTS
jgi:trehalose-phosphatase